MSKVFARITYKDGSYNTVREKSSVLETKEAAVAWVNKQLNDAANSSSAGYPLRDTMVYFGEIQEEYSAERTWSLSPTGISKGKAKIVTDGKVGSIEI